MPRQYNELTCDPCRKRKVRCDEQRPVCARCAAHGRHCTRSKAKPCVGLDKPDQQDVGDDVKVSVERHLGEAEIAQLFNHYITNIAAWYDLGDDSRNFAISVPQIAREEPLLFCAVIALSAIHTSKTANKTAAKTAGRYHRLCVRQLIALREDSELLTNGVALATVCLLRSYEILNEIVDPNRHLQGAYSLASPERIHVGLGCGLFMAGFWNYLREDITFSLYNMCPLKIDLQPLSILFERSSDGSLNTISFILGQIINSTFSSNSDTEEWHSLYNRVIAWHASLSFKQKPFSYIFEPADVLPRMWFVQDCHASALHYYLTACCILTNHAPPGEQVSFPRIHDDLSSFYGANIADELDALASEICGIAFTSCTPSVIVNAFGPIHYCAKHLRTPQARQETKSHLVACKRIIGWPVARLIEDLQTAWGWSP